MPRKKVRHAIRGTAHGWHPANPAQQRRNRIPSLGEQLQALGPEAVEFFHRLAIVNEFCLWKECPRPDCRRAGQCSGDNAECFDERREELKRAILRCVVWLMCTANVSQDEFYDYLEEVTGGDDGMALGGFTP